MPGMSRALTLRSRYRTEITDAAPAFVTILMMPFTNTIAHGFIGGYGAFIICKFCTYKLHPWQKTWPGYASPFPRSRRSSSPQTTIPAPSSTATGCDSA